MFSSEIFLSIILKKIGSIRNLRTGSRSTVKCNDLSITGDQKTVSGSVKKIIKQHMAQCGNITGTAKNSNHLIIFVYRHSKHNSHFVVNTAFQRITESLFSAYCLFEISSVRNILGSSIIIIRIPIFVDERYPFQICFLIDGHQTFFIFFGKKFF